MGTISFYKALYSTKEIKQPTLLKEPEKEFPGKPILSDAKLITLAEHDVDTKDAITAHRLKDYRRKHFNLVLLPNVNIIFDRILEGSDYWNALLRNESSH